MAQPTAYNRQASFSNIQAQAPDDPLPAATLDAELNAIKVTLDDIRTNLALIQRDDGDLANASVGLDQLSEEIEVGWEAPEVWVTATAYVVGNTVFRGSAFYRCLVAHTAGVFATDLAASKWELIVDLSGLTIVAASQIAVTPAGGIASVTVQAALEELDSEKAASSHTHPASAVSDSTAAGRTLLTAANAAAQRSALGLGALALENSLPVTDITAQLAFTGDISPSALAADTNDWAPTSLSTSSTIKFSASQAISLTGLLATTDGDVKILHNVGSYPITLAANNASSASANRFVFAGPVVLAPNTDIALQYDNTSATKGWRKWATTPTLPIFAAQLTKSASNLLLSRFDGLHLFINGANEVIPAAGVTLAAPATTGTTYYIYAYMSSGTMTLEASTTGYAADANYGHRTKSGDTSRTLVGMARTVSSAWVDSATQRFVRSYFNDPGVALLGAFTADRTTTSTSFVEINSEIRLEFLVWTGEIARIAAAASTTHGSTNGLIATSLAFDGTTAEDTLATAFGSGDLATAHGGGAPGVEKSGLSEGHHDVRLIGKTAAGTATWKGSGTAGTRTTMRGYLRR